MTEIYVLLSFRLYEHSSGDERVENGKRFWFGSFETAIEYLEKAGKPVPGKENTYYDEPSEYRWDYVVIEEVPEGPMTKNKVMGWWKANYSEGKMIGYSPLETSPIKNSEQYFNFTEVG